MRKTTIYLNKEAEGILSAIQKHFNVGNPNIFLKSNLNLSAIIVEGLKLFCEKYNINYKEDSK